MRTWVHRMVSTLLVLALGVPLLALGSPVRAQSEVQATVNPDQLNVRSAPQRRAEVLGQYARGTVLRITGREDVPTDDGVWVYATPVDGGLTGWVRSDYLNFAEGQTVFDAPIIGPTTGGSAPAANDAAPAAEPAAAPASGGVTGQTVESINFRAGPALNYAIHRMLPAGVPFTATGRNARGNWLQVNVDGQVGWLYVPLIRIAGDINSLPVVDGAAPADDAPVSQGTAPVVTAGVVPSIGSRVYQIYRVGQRLGNRRDVFSKVGDSITWNPQFLAPVGVGGLQLHDYGNLQAVVSFYTRTAASNHNSFANQSAAAWGGWTSADLLDPARTTSDACQPDESPLVCEYRLSKPAVALIMIGTNDIRFGVGTETYRANLERIVQTSIDKGVIPVLSTIPDNYADAAQGARVNEFNGVIASVARAYGVPLWNYWLAMQDLPGHGMSGDGYHPSTPPTGETAVFTADNLRYGFTVRNLTALMVLDRLYRQVLG